MPFDTITFTCNRVFLHCSSSSSSSRCAGSFSPDYSVRALGVDALSCDLCEAETELRHSFS